MNTPENPRANIRRRNLRKARDWKQIERRNARFAKRAASKRACEARDFSAVLSAITD